MSVFIIAEGQADPFEIVTEAGATIANVVTAVAERLQHNAGDILIFIEEQDEPLTIEAIIEEVAPPDRSFHAHRCRHIGVAVTYNQKTIAGDFGPSKTIGHLRKWAVEHETFNFHANDAAQLRLQLPNGTFPDERAHLGQFARHPDCGVTFTLAEHKKPQG